MDYYQIYIVHRIKVPCIGCHTRSMFILLALGILEWFVVGDSSGSILATSAVDEAMSKLG